MKLLRSLLLAAAALCAAAPAHADFTFTQGAGTTAFDFICFSTKHCFATAITNSAGTEIFTTASPASMSIVAAGNTATVSAGGALKVDGSAVTQPVSGTVTAAQGTAANLNATVVGTGTFVTQSTLAAETTKVIGTTRTLGNAGAILDFAGQNAASPANSVLMGAQFNTAPTTITTGNASPLQLDSAGNLLVNIKAGAGSGGTASNFAAAFPSSGTAIGVKNGANMVNLAADGSSNLFTTIANGANQAAVKPASTGPAAGDPALVVAISPNSVNANGQTTMSASAPITVASDQKVSTGNASVAINVSTGTTTQLVAISGSTKVYVTAWDVMASGAGTAQIVYGTGSNCGTGTTIMTGAYPLAAQAGIAKGDGSAAVLITPAGQAVCIATVGTTQYSGSLTFQQF